MVHKRYFLVYGIFSDILCNSKIAMKLTFTYLKSKFVKENISQISQLTKL